MKTRQQYYSNSFHWLLARALKDKTDDRIVLSVRMSWLDLNV